jgi:hypothetical protein
MTDARKTELYAALVNEADKIAIAGGHPNRFGMLKVLCDEWGHEVNRDAVDLIEKLYRDGFCGA